MENSNKNLEEERMRVGKSWGKVVKSRYKMILKYAGKSILDIGCGSGEYVKSLLKAGYEVKGIDILYNENWKNIDNDSFNVGEINNLPYSYDSFDTLLAFEVLEHLENPDKALKEMYKVTNNNIIISVPNCKQPEVFRLSGLAYHHWIDRTHKQFFTIETLKEKMQANGFNIVEENLINPIFPEVLSLSSWFIPTFITQIISRLSNIIPFKRKYHMTILIVASKIKN